MSSDLKKILGRAYDQYQLYKQLERELTVALERSVDGLPKYELWLLNYYKTPYLILESDENIAERYIDISTNMMEISEDCKISPTPARANNLRLTQLWTEMKEELKWRGILDGELNRKAIGSIAEYFKDGPPIGCQMFGSTSHIAGEWLVKYSKSKYVKEMITHGRFKISPASKYSKGSYNKAIRDVETQRQFKFRALNELLAGQKAISTHGMDHKITNGFVQTNISTGDYYLFCTCKELDRRMPTDFESDAALIIKNKAQFIDRLRKAMLSKFKAWQFMEGEVYYYDPYNDTPTELNLEFWKHFSFGYQKEHRCVLRQDSDYYGTLEPFFVEIGSLDDIAEAVYA